MFTGIIQELGVVKSFDKSGSVYKLAVGSKEIFDGIGIGDSLAVNGVCLTLVDKRKSVLYFDVMEETVRRSNLALLRTEEKVNLESSLKAGGPLGGHFVLGHVDCVGNVIAINKTGEDVVMGLEIPSEFNHLVVEKGSVAIDGISLTVGEAKIDFFSVYLIPHTLKATTLGLRQKGSKVNIEFDIIGKYIARFKELEKGSRVTEDFLKSKGFV